MSRILRVSPRAVGLPALVTVMLALLLLGSQQPTFAQVGSGPSQFCHVTDGVFTDCNPPTAGNEEWSDITPTTFAATGGVVIADQADLVDNSKIADFEAGLINQRGAIPP